MIDYCAACGAGFASEEMYSQHKCDARMVPGSVFSVDGDPSMVNVHHAVPGFGELGESPAEFERRRIAGLSGQVPATARPPMIERDRSMPVAEQQRRLEMTEALKPLIGEAFGQITQFLTDLQHDIQAQTALMRTLDAPVEAVVASHERASESFETLRSDLAQIGLETPNAIKDLARVMDTAGLNDAQSRAERRFEQLAKMIEGKLDAFLQAQTTAFKGVALDMTKVLHLLERLQARELRQTKARMERSTKRAVRSGPHV